MEEYSMNVNLHLESTKCMEIKYTTRTSVESICLDLCERLKIGPVARHLFSLRINQTSIYLANYYTLFSDSFKNGRVGPSLDLRMRYKPASIQELKKLDARAFEYYYLQVRDDIVKGLVPGLAYDDCQPELTGLCITDMFRYMLENSVPMQAVERDHKKFMNKEIVKRHRFYLSTPIHENLLKLNRNMKDQPNNISFVKEQYLLEVENRAPCYLQEIHEAMLDRTGPDGNQSLLVNIKTPTWIDLCTIEELGFIAFRDDCSVELSRLNGIPIYIRFKSSLLMLSFVSLLDGYYRLSCKWTFNLCQKLRTESLSKLYWMKCHGPVGGQFSYHKLEIKASNQVGSYIIRESESSYSTYYIDVCVKASSKPISLKVSVVADGYMLEGNATIFDNMQSLIKAYKDPDGEIYFRECVPPSDFGECC
ncbi:hypothetical protein D910_08279 [Dendroctonus ponderosae]|uniref:FERM domain-containing protein n=1 Tax=Dendroctonus ponderosae TaxID=77166 RepID=U4UD11_DENPD|nr:hypothetical protein D910_08279 [Dendroctonus ponderosae]